MRLPEPEGQARVMKDNKQLNVLLLKSRELFMRHGLKKLTMDEIAKELGMSKKTIYQFVENKSELVRLTLEHYLQEERGQVEEIMSKSVNSVEEMVEIIIYFLEVLHEFNAVAMQDMQRYYPAACALYNDYRFNFMLKCIEGNLRNGVAQGYYREDLETDIISKIYILGMEVLYNQELFPSKHYLFLNIWRGVSQLSFTWHRFCQRFKIPSTT